MSLANALKKAASASLKKLGGDVTIRQVTAGAYIVSANSIAAGSFKITVSNVSGGSLSEAIVINFVALKGASS